MIKLAARGASLHGGRTSSRLDHSFLFSQFLAALAAQRYGKVTGEITFWALYIEMGDSFRVVSSWDFLICAGLLIAALDLSRRKSVHTWIVSAHQGMD